MKIENLSNIEIYGRKLSDFLLPDQIEILCREINKDCPLEEASASKDVDLEMPTDEEIKECSQLDKVIHFLRRRLNPKITIDQEIKLTAGEIACYLVDFSVQSNRQLLVEYETWKTDNDIKNLLPDQLADWYIEIITNLKRIKTT